MCAFTTKTAVYALAKGFAGMEILIPLGVVMALYGVVYAVLENDARRLLAYSIISQVGYMVVGVGIGTELAINGTCAHAFAHVLYKGLLFMGVGSVLYMTGTSRFSELGGLYKKMPRTLLFTLVGCASIAAFPLLSGFVSKSMIVAAAFEDHLTWAAFLLLAASAGTFLYNGLKLPWLIWFGENNCSREAWDRAAEPPVNMQVAMGLAATLCVLVGVYTPYLYRMLPYPVTYEPYTAYHLAETLQILLFTALGFFLLIRKLTPERKISIDLDWFYRKGVAWIAAIFDAWLNGLNTWVHRVIARDLTAGLAGYCKDGPARLLMGVARPLWELSGISTRGMDNAQARMLKRHRTGFFSAGSTAILAAALLLLLLILAAR
jgi:multicomponent Na+:H+ antiporter subunit D